MCVHVCVREVFLSINFCAFLLARAVKLDKKKQRDKEYSVSLQQASHSSSGCIYTVSRMVSTLYKPTHTHACSQTHTNTHAHTHTHTHTMLSDTNKCVHFVVFLQQMLLVDSDMWSFDSTEQFLLICRNFTCTCA